MKAPPAQHRQDNGERTKAEKEFDRWVHTLSVADQQLVGNIGSRLLSVKPRMDSRELAKRIRKTFEAEQRKRSV